MFDFFLHLLWGLSCAFLDHVRKIERYAIIVQASQEEVRRTCAANVGAICLVITRDTRLVRSLNGSLLNLHCSPLFTQQRGCIKLAEAA